MQSEEGKGRLTALSGVTGSDCASVGVLSC